MNKYISALIVLSVVVSAAAKPELDVPPKAHPDSGGWAELIKPDLSNVDYPAGVWTCEEGVFTASKDQAVWSKADYGSYILDLEFKTAEGSNSGVIIHCSDTKRWIPNSIEVQIADDFCDKWAKSPKNFQCGAIFGHVNPSKSAVKKPGEWNRMTITTKGKMVHVLLNGKTVSTMDMAKFTSTKTNPDGSNVPRWLGKPVAGMEPKGKIGLQGKHAGAPIWFRNVRIKTLH